MRLETLAVFIIITIPNVSAQGLMEKITSISLNLEQILIICMIVCFILGLILYKFFGINEKKLLITMVVMAIIFLLIDFFYQKYVVYG